MRRAIGLVAAACAILVATTGCGADPAPSAESPATTTADNRIARAGGPATTGERKQLGNGLTITVSAPKSFVPTDSAYPEADRALGFEVVVENGGETPYRPTLLALSASVNGSPSKQVIDSTQGYTGVVGPADVPGGGTVRFSVAFAVPATKAWVRVSAQPDPAAAAVVTVFDESA